LCSVQNRVANQCAIAEGSKNNQKAGGNEKKGINKLIFSSLQIMIKKKKYFFSRWIY
jgi:hypothetical protein